MLSVVVPEVSRKVRCSCSCVVLGRIKVASLAPYDKLWI